MPPSIFDMAAEVYVLTYQFEASHLKHTLDMYKLDYVTRWIDTAGELTAIPRDDRELKRKYRDLIHLYEGSMNAVGKDMSALSATKWKHCSADDLKTIGNHTRNFFQYGAMKKTVAAEYCMWAAYGEGEKAPGSAEFNKTRRFKVDNYSTSCVPFNARAVNKHRERCALAYLVNVYEPVPIKMWFASRGVKCDDDRYALSVMLQWIWRSRIRDGKEIYLYLPSSRMRRL